MKFIECFCLKKFFIKNLKRISKESYVDNLDNRPSELIIKSTTVEAIYSK